VSCQESPLRTVVPPKPSASSSSSVRSTLLAAVIVKEAVAVLEVSEFAVTV